MTDFENQILAAIQRAMANGTSLLSIAKSAGVHYASLHGFVNGGRKISLETGGKLAKALGLTLTTEEES